MPLARRRRAPQLCPSRGAPELISRASRIRAWHRSLLDNAPHIPTGAVMWRFKTSSAKAKATRKRAAKPFDNEELPFKFIIRKRSVELTARKRPVGNADFRSVAIVRVCPHQGLAWDEERPVDISPIGLVVRTQQIPIVAATSQRCG